MRIDGGSAFPRYDEFQHFDEDTGKYVDTSLPVDGMSLRDYLAARAMQLRWANWEVGIDVNGFASTQDLAALAANCYRVADALLAERNKP